MNEPPRSLAASALRQGQAMLGRSFRMHRPRGAFCHDGWCQQCKVQLQDGRVVLACQVAGEDPKAMRPRGALMRLVGAIAERQPPWFHEGRFLRPRALRQTYLNLLRRMSGALPLPGSPPAVGEAWRDVACDVLVVGGGIAGLSAGCALSAAGHSVVIVDAGRRRAGRWQAERGVLKAAALAAGCTVMEDTLCVGLYEQPRRALCVDGSGSIVVRHSDIVAATGAYDRLIPFINNDLPGIIGVRALEILLAQSALLDDAQVGIYGEKAEVERAVEAMSACGQHARWIAGPASMPSATQGTAAHPHVRIEKANGMARIRCITVTGGVRLECDVLVLAFSQPGYEIQMQREARLEVHGCPPRLIPDVAGLGVLVVGEAAGDTEGATAAQDAALRAAEWLRTKSCKPATTISRHSQLAELHGDAFICPCEDVRVRDVRQAIRDGYGDIELIKRHTGAATGPCQGKICHGNLMGCLAHEGVEVRLPTQRPLIRPVTFAQFAGAAEEQPDA